MYSGKKIAIIIPALNEAGSIGQVIREIPDYVDEIAVVDNGSTDQTDLIARNAGARIVYQSVRGYGAACLAGIRSLRNVDVVGFIDGDYSDYPEDLATLLEPVACGDCDFAMGQRECVDNNMNAISLHQKVGIAGASIHSKTQCSSISSGRTIAIKDAIKDVDFHAISSRGFPNSYTSLKFMGLISYKLAILDSAVCIRNLHEPVGLVWQVSASVFRQRVVYWSHQGKQPGVSHRKDGDKPPERLPLRQQSQRSFLEESPIGPLSVA